MKQWRTFHVCTISMLVVQVAVIILTALGNMSEATAPQASTIYYLGAFGLEILLVAFMAVTSIK